MVNYTLKAHEIPGRTDMRIVLIVACAAALAFSAWANLPADAGQSADMPGSVTTTTK
jgi:hypothetical protein